MEETGVSVKMLERNRKRGKSREWKINLQDRPKDNKYQKRNG
jgi:hypothetical protein